MIQRRYGTEKADLAAAAYGNKAARVLAMVSGRSEQTIINWLDDHAGVLKTKNIRQLVLTDIFGVEERINASSTVEPCGPS